MKHLMVDIETLDNKPGAVILSISAIQFDLETGETGAVFDQHISAEDSVKQGLKIGADTTLWWMQQDEAARESIVNAQNHFIVGGLKDTLNQFNTWMYLTFAGNEFEIWGNSNRFDLGLPAHAYDLVDLRHAWDFRLERDVRTLVSLNPEIKNSTPFEGIRHNGVDDCKHQIKYCSKIWQSLIN